ncbi:putative methyltransferase [Poriferisphaera corsica]|uniref:site-specific DNA-methyltransferase (adenine-specific) n=1 Tax=Poriferisphaera corsica TaxID=2528020 RepID=A0A517YS69_9BACT|nr:site-specific DNA-methyltransferase [Poriferisphaera corsica]QDU33062.1 putative methyltransferase [Poriferisphaera corsica]
MTIAQSNTLEQLDGESLDLLDQRLQALKALLPEAFDLDGNLVKDKLLESLKPASYEPSDDIPAFGLAWPGKQQAFAAAGVPTTATLRPCPDQSVDFDTTKNLLIEGDNLEVLKTLQRSYHGKVKMIYIDPPYNTGKDFVYPDNYGEGLDTYLKRTEQKDADGFWQSTNSETSGRKHANWLSMMAPRLTLARNLLREDGVILISIDDNEVANLRLLCDEVFGAENCLATLVWDKNRKNDAKYFSVGHEYMLVYAKSKSVLVEQSIIYRGEKEGVDQLKEVFESLRSSHGDNWGVIRDGLLKYYKDIPEDDPREPLKRYRKVDEQGPYRDDGNINWPGGGGPTYDVLHPVTKKVCTLPTSGWRYPTPERFWEEVEKGNIVFGEDEVKVPSVRTNIFEKHDQVMASVHYSYAQTATNQFNELFGGQRVFENPKPTKDLKTLTAYVTEKEDLVLDFFAGSGTTGHAVMAQNAEDGGNRRYICVQLPEPLDEPVTLDDGVVCETIFDLTRERLKRAGSKIKEEAGLNAEKIDTGLRVFKLDSSNFTPWNSEPTSSQTDMLERLEQLADHTVPGRTETDILWEILLKMGLVLDLQLERFEVEGTSFFGVGDRTKVISTETSIPTAALEALLDQDIPPSELVVLDGAFENDTDRANIATFYKQRKDDDGQPLCNLKVV